MSVLLAGKDTMFMYVRGKKSIELSAIGKADHLLRGVCSWHVRTSCRGIVLLILFNNAVDVLALGGTVV